MILILMIKTSCRSTPSHSPHSWSTPGVNTGKWSYQHFLPCGGSFVASGLRCIDKRMSIDFFFGFSCTRISVTPAADVPCPWSSLLFSDILCSWLPPWIFDWRSIRCWVWMCFFWFCVRRWGKVRSWGCFGRGAGWYRPRRRSERWRWCWNLPVAGAGVDVGVLGLDGID